MGWGWDDALFAPLTFGGYSAVKHGVVEPVVNKVKSAATGLYDDLYKDPANAKKAGLDAVAAGLTGLGEADKAYAMQGKSEALSKFGRANAIQQALYGDPASLSTAAYTGGNFQSR